MTPHSHDLIQQYLSGTISDVDAATLEQQLRADAALRDVYLDAMNLDSALETAAQAAETALNLPVPPSMQALSPRKTSPSRWLSLRPVAAAAAGVVFGAFTASLAWALAVPKPAHERVLPLVDGGFEQTVAQVQKDMPRTLGRWGGDPVEVVESFAGIKPRSGQGMVRYLASATRDELRASSTAADLWQIVALPGSGNRSVRVRAWVNAVAPAAFTLGAVAVAELPESPFAMWQLRSSEDPRVLAASMKKVTFSGSTSGWQMAELTMQVPDQARVLVLDVAAHRMLGVTTNDGFPGQFVDDVSVTFTDEPALH